MKNVDEIAKEAAREHLLNLSERSLLAIIKAAIETGIAPIEHALLETRVKAAAIQRELDEFQQKLDAEVERRHVVERFVSRLRENQAFDRAAREVWKKQLETVTELFKKQTAGNDPTPTQ